MKLAVPLLRKSFRHLHHVTMLHSISKERLHTKNGGDEKQWKVIASDTARNCKNKIRQIVDNLVLEPNPEKRVIPLSLGDPTVFGNLNPSEEALEAIIESIKSGKNNGYAPCVGTAKACQAVANYLSFNGVLFDARDIILCSGCSSSLDYCITVLADAKKDHNIVIPRPGFSLYNTIADSLGVKIRTYDLLPERSWDIDLKHLENQIDENTVAIILNNPSNPCGSVYDECHLRDFLDIAYRHRVPVIADEIYERIVFPGTPFVSVASIDSGVPILVCGGIAKRFLVPGWRMGWIAIHDPVCAFDGDIRKGLNNLSQRTIGSNSIVQGALPTILKMTPQSYHDDVINTLYNNAKLAYDIIKNVKGLAPIMPEGTMYMMIKIEMQHFTEFHNELEFIQRLMEEESVFCLPGKAFGIAGYMRIVITVPSNLLQEACNRMLEFCNRYYT